MNSLISKLIAIATFAIAFGYIEAAVVVYLRQLYYSGGFSLPFYPYLFYFGLPADFIRFFSLPNYFIEIVREVATMVMLFTFSYLAGKDLRERLAVLLLTWGVWDIFYYVFLFLMIRWPPSLLTMDVIFLIPVPWLAPVIVPIAASSIMAGISIFMIIKNEHQRHQDHFSISIKRGPKTSRNIPAIL